MNPAGPHPVLAVSLAEARRIALAAQGFGAARSRAVSGWPRIAATVDRLGLLQVDSVNVLARAHYLPVYSRIGAYDRGALDARAFKGGRKRALFEYWGHEASLLPLDLHPLFRWRMARAARGEGIYKSLARFAREQHAYVDVVRSTLRERGPMSAAELADPGPRGPSWWGWNNGKIALEYLFWSGEITAAERRGNFERVYGLTADVLPSDVVDRPTPDDADAIRALALRSAEALGIGTEFDIRDYYRLPVADARRAVEELVEEGRLVPATVEGWKQPAFLVAGVAAPETAGKATALLSPFDPLVWFRPRTERLFDFHYRIEIYTPAPKRVFGYYVLPFLYRGMLAGRVDLKAERPQKNLRVMAAHAEPGRRRAGLPSALADELRRLALWLGLETVTVEPRGDLAAALDAALD